MTRTSILTTLALFVGLAFTAPADALDDCVSWDGTTTLQAAVDANACVSIVPGSYTVEAETYIVGTTEIRGNGATLTFVNNQWPVNPTKANASILYVRNTGTLTVSNLTLDGNNIISYLIGPGRYNADRMTMRNGACSAAGIGRAGVSITNSTLTHNGWNCQPYSGLVEGAAIYGQADGADNWFAPWISGNTISGSNGPALDINGVWGGTLAFNTIFGNSTWAGVSLYGASYWNVTHNLVSQPATTEVQAYHPYCRPTGARAGDRSAAIILCQDSGDPNLATSHNTIAANAASSGYGILLVGADEVQPWMTPRLNSILGNRVIGSLIGCADDLRVGQWSDGNVWSGNNCNGVPLGRRTAANSGPSRF